MKAVSILGEGEWALSSGRWGEPCQRDECASYELLPDASPSVDQLTYWPAHKELFPILSHLAIQVKSIGLRQWEEITAPVLVHLPQWMKKKWFPLLRFIVTLISSLNFSFFVAFKMKFNYPLPSHFQFSGRDGSGTWKKVRDRSGTGIPSDPDPDDHL